MIANNPLDTLRTVFGYRTFRPFQEEIVTRLIGGGDAFVLMPTGGGKSLCYQIPAIHRPGVGIVVSPLISLMKDQVDTLRENGVAAAAYNSAMGEREARQVLARLHAGELDLLYVAPERLMTDAFLERLREIPVALFAIDEAHCVSQWGHDFRPEYVGLGRLRGLFPGVPVIALTATADVQTRSDIIDRLGLRDAQVYVTGFDRPNIRYTVVDKQKPFHQLLAFLGNRPQDAGIVYALSRKRVEEVAGKLRDAGIEAAAYHAGLADGERGRVQEAFLRDDVRVVVATVAFGMGIDKPNVRFVVHYDLPKNIESYYQETGRAGRDGLPAEALLLFGYGDIAVSRSLIESGNNPEQVRIELHKLNAMVGFAEAGTCRREALLGYFGERLAEPCGNCDLCLDPPESFDATEDARKALSCVYRVGQRFGMGHVIDVLRGSKNERIQQLGHDRLSTYGIGADRSAEAWGSIIRQLIHRGYLEQDLANYSVLKLTPAARPLLRGEVSLTLAKPRVKVAPVKKEPKRKGVVASLAERDEDLFQALRALRKRLADEQQVPPYVIFSDATLVEMATLRPATMDDLLRVNGVGEQKLGRYGAAFLEAIRNNS
ncbi:ATP-dependent DNA helicase RecQ [Geobacter metallireducens RCH3]|uniref:DNA helicase RecQ n=1 Tax=Geobacter metallireducens (strain ATCC 53774 / DSM 7210 / GS-15) TaxID=269799 RepID=Q39S39_GEOMG|nr:DNA helicase RecQ [Geobacter metallireducens]ABB32935.1 ATP-dependent DNA helicase RecQ [Geobacter metallireducens GS-15]EHP88930.1 ATP-dependent DNA helicase RecQ [Geobacter metallireducens RCH3]